VTPQAVAITTACGSAEEAERIATALVEERLVACAQVQPVRSIYRWKGEIERADEWLVTAKTRFDLIEAVVECVRTLHGYDLPEAVAVPIVGGSTDYLAWVRAETAGSP